MPRPPCPECGSLNRHHFFVRVGTTMPADLRPCPLDPSNGKA